MTPPPPGARTPERPRAGLVYRLVCFICRPVMKVATGPVFRGLEHIRGIDGGFLLASTHQSPYDIPAVLYAVDPTGRPIDFVTTTAFLKKPGIGQLFRAMNTVGLNKGRVDGSAVREMVSRLKRGRAVCLFPEAQVRPEAESAIHGGSFRPGLGRIAMLAGVPVVPCIVMDTARCGHWSAWLPMPKTRFAVAFGRPLVPPPIPETAEARRAAQKQLESDWQAAVTALARQLEPRLTWRQNT